MKNERQPKKPNSYRNNALPVPTPVLTGSGSLGPSVKEISGIKATPRRFDFAIKRALYDGIVHSARITVQALYARVDTAVMAGSGSG